MQLRYLKGSELGRRRGLQEKERNYRENQASAISLKPNKARISKNFYEVLTMLKEKKNSKRTSTCSKSDYIKLASMEYLHLLKVQ